MQNTEQDHPWKHLHSFHEANSKVHLRELLKQDARNAQMVTQHEDIVLDYTHEKLNPQDIKNGFKELVQKAGLRNKIQGLFNGDHINFTENRAVLHTCLRAPVDSKIHDTSKEPLKQVFTDIHEVLRRIEDFSNRVRSGEFVGATGKKLNNLVVIGIGGSYLSIEFVYESLRSHPKCQDLAKGRKLRFLANVDPIDFNRAVEGLNVEETLFLVNSKTFTTAETILNAKSCKQWVIDQYAKIDIKDQALIASKHFIAASTALPLTKEFGISPENVFGFWDFVGGRFSVWSAIGILPLSITFGFETTKSFQAGGHSIDSHLISQQEISKNIPLLLGLIGFHLTTIQGYSSRAIIPYCQALCKFAPHIQQLDMESNGKRVNKQGEPVNFETTVVNFGEPGTNGQHSFFQLLHQGRVTPVEFIGFTKSQQPYQVIGNSVNNHEELMSNFFSQPDALAIGKTRQQLTAEGCKEELLPHKEFPGDRPSFSLLFLGELDAYKCGQLLALYEHRTSIEGFIWNVNSYDQYGVELGKVLAKNVRGLLEKNGEGLKESGINSATQSLLSKYLSHK